MLKFAANELATTLRTARLLAVAAVGVALVVDPAVAQQTSQRPLSVGLAGGLARTSGGTGYQALGVLELRTPLSPLNVRAEGVFADWGGVGVRRVSALTGGLILTPLPNSKVAPYALAAAGGYVASGGGMRAGWSLGLGLRLPDFASHLFVESRVHAFRWDGSNFQPSQPAYTASDTWKYVWVPVSAGGRF